MATTKARCSTPLEERMQGHLHLRLRLLVASTILDHPLARLTSRLRDSPVGGAPGAPPLRPSNHAPLGLR
eukprot:8652691-Alexandrium_andersonii.AAC.1